MPAYLDLDKNFNNYRKIQHLTLFQKMLKSFNYKVPILLMIITFCIAQLSQVLIMYNLTKYLIKKDTIDNGADSFTLIKYFGAIMLSQFVDYSN